MDEIDVPTRSIPVSLQEWNGTVRRQSGSNYVSGLEFQKREYSRRRPETFGISIAFDRKGMARRRKLNAQKPAISGPFR
jgi:hypothetical protein